MQIACPNCNTHYALDDRLVPAGGAPVQCTRCGLVFTAHPPGSDPASAAPEPPRGTLPFGATPPGPGPARTEQFAGASPAGSTQVFGQGTPARSLPREPLPPPPRTQVFGAGPADAPRAPDAGASAARTMVFGGAAAEAPRSPGAGEPAGTRVFGGPPAGAAPSGASAAGSTQVFGGAEPARTQVFGAAPPGPHPPAGAGATQVFGAGPSRAATALFGGAAAGGGGLDLPDASEPPGAPPTQQFGRGGLDLPGEPEPLPGLSSRPRRPDPAERALAEQLQRRNQRAVLALVGLVAALGLAYAGWRAWQARGQVPAAVRAQYDEAFAHLRKDDASSRSDALHAFDGIAARYPTWLPVQAAEALALTLELDDQRAILRRALASADQETTLVARLEADRSPSDWREQADAARARLVALKKLTDPMIDAVNKLEARVNAARETLNRLPPGTPDEELTRLRADAVFAGVAGRDRAIEYAERYRQSSARGDGWGDVAHAEYAVSTRVSPETAQQALDAMNALIARDSTFLRPYVLAGRLALQLRQRDAALARLDAAVTLNPRHQLAQTLLEQERAAAGPSPR